MAANLIILFAKAPVPGRVKTRLLPAIGSHHAAELHIAFVTDMLHRFRNLPYAKLELHVDKETDAWIASGVARKLQIAGDLGLKMIHGLDLALRAGHERVLILGGDAPTLPESHLQQLLEPDADVTLGPAEDGGFYAIAARRIHAEMFRGVEWSREDTLERTIRSIEAAGLSVTLGPAWFDIDEPESLFALARQPDLPPSTAACLMRVIGARRDNV